MNSKNVASVFFILSIFALSIIVSSAFAAEDTMDVNVTISHYSEITLIPQILNWTNVTLGAEAGNKTIAIMNTGSLNVTDIYVYGDALTDEIVRPYGETNTTKYAAASVLTIDNATATNSYFIGRIEWNWTEVLDNFNYTHLTSPVSWGIFRNASSEYAWAVGNGTEGVCNQTDAQLAIEDHIDTGVMSTRTPDDGSIANSGADENWSFFNVNRGTNVLNGYCVAINATCEKIYIYKFDMRPEFSTCTNAKYLTENDIPPGFMYEVDANAFIPRGLPAGELNRATLTFVAT